ALLVLAAEEGHLDLLALVLARVVLHRSQSNERVFAPLGDEAGRRAVYASRRGSRAARSRVSRDRLDERDRLGDRALARGRGSAGGRVWTRAGAGRAGAARG